MKTITFTIYGVPGTPGRPAKNVKTINEQIALIASQHKPENGLLKGSIELDLRFFLQRPKSLSENVELHTKKPDIDNLAKSVIKGLEGVIYESDAQINSLLASKEYGEPRVEIAIYTDFEVL